MKCVLNRPTASLFDSFRPDACLINRYEPGTRLSLHRDYDERDSDAPIVSVSLGVPATFQWGGLRRNDRTRRIALEHGDVVVWGGASRFVSAGEQDRPRRNCESLRMSLRSIAHLLLHAAVPGLVAWLLFREQWRRAWLIMLATMIVDLDHLLADPLYDPNRCSIGFHPLHRLPAIAVYGLLTVPRRTRLIGLGLLIHMALDFVDCIAMKGWLA